LTSCQIEACTHRVDQAGKHLATLQSRIAGISTMQSAIGGFISNICMLTILIFSIQSVSNGQLAGVLLGVLALGALMSFEAVQPLPIAAQNLEANRAAARRLYELVDTKPIVRDPIEPLLLPEDNHLSVKELSFHYPTQVNVVPTGVIPDFGLKNISFSLLKGKHIAIVGPSGAGKTTLINLLQRFWEYQQGSIQLSGNEFHQYTQEAILSRIAAIPQSAYLFSTTIKQNLLIARPEASDDEIILAAQAAHLHNTIQSLPDGYDTWVGEHGLQLSAGERQRLAIARVLLKDSPLLILDEPSSNLDPVTETKVLDSLRKLSLGRSTITISQRFVGLESMDSILVLKDGRLIEYGSHEVLLSIRGLYYRMWALYNQII
jgi:ATP-binding cassette subfamily C protein CydC